MKAAPPTESQSFFQKNLAAAHPSSVLDTARCGGGSILEKFVPFQTDLTMRFGPDRYVCILSSAKTAHS